MSGEESSSTIVTIEEQDKIAARWRRAILNLSETLLSACDERQDLSPFLMEAMHSALENLLVYGEANDLLTLEEWLNEEKLGSHRHAQAEEGAPAGALPAYLPAAERLSSTPLGTSDANVTPLQSSISSTRQVAPDGSMIERRINGERRVHNERRGVPRLNGEYRSGRDRRTTSTPEFPGNAQPGNAQPGNAQTVSDAQPSNTSPITTP